MVEVSRCTRTPDDPTVVAYYAEIKVWCLACKKPFEFIGLPMGMSPGQPRTSVDGQEARMPIKPVGEVMPIDVAGFGVEFHQA